jgi:hypothetical protein
MSREATGLGPAPDSTQIAPVDSCESPRGIRSQGLGSSGPRDASDPVTARVRLGLLAHPDAQAFALIRPRRVL